MFLFPETISMTDFLTALESLDNSVMLMIVNRTQIFDIETAGINLTIVQDSPEYVAVIECKDGFITINAICGNSYYHVYYCLI